MSLLPERTELTKSKGELASEHEAGEQNRLIEAQSCGDSRILYPLNIAERVVEITLNS